VTGVQTCALRIWLRAQESRMRRISIGHRGLVTPNTCRPIAHWDAVHVFAYLHREGLPVHPAYAMTAGGYYDRRWLRVHPLGTAVPPASAVYRRDHAAWEELYYGDVRKTAQAARAHMWKEVMPRLSATRSGRCCLPVPLDASTPPSLPGPPRPDLTKLARTSPKTWPALMH